EGNRRALVEPPEELGRAEGPPALPSQPPYSHVERLGLNQGVRLLPESHLAGLAKEPAVSDDAMSTGRLPRQPTGLRASGDGRNHLAQVALPAGLGQTTEPRCPLEQTAGQADGVDQDQRSGLLQGRPSFPRRDGSGTITRIAPEESINDGDPRP